MWVSSTGDIQGCVPSQALQLPSQIFMHVSGIKLPAVTLHVVVVFALVNDTQKMGMAQQSCFGSYTQEKKLAIQIIHLNFAMSIVFVYLDPPKTSISLLGLSRTQV